MIATYYRLAKPGIIYGNAITLLGGYLLAAHGRIHITRLLAVLIGTSLVIGSGCVFNNLIDRDIDRLMSRTKQRALVRAIISPQAAVLYGLVLGLLGFTLLIVGTNWITVALGLVALVDYVVLYGFAKRRSHYGTLVGTIAGSAPIVAGYTAVTGRIDGGAALLFVILATWQMAHFYAIAMYRATDYAAAGIPVISVVKGMPTTKRQIMGYIAAFIVACSLLSVYGYTGYTFLVVMALLAVSWLWRGWHVYQSAEASAWGRRMFLFSLIVLPVLSLMLAVGAELP